MPRGPRISGVIFSPVKNSQCYDSLKFNRLKGIRKTNKKAQMLFCNAGLISTTEFFMFLVCAFPIHISVLQ